jgi:hypothetical protein
MIGKSASILTCVNNSGSLMNGNIDTVMSYIC